MYESLISMMAKRGQALVIVFLTTLLIGATLVLGTVTLYARGTAERVKHAGVVVQFGSGQVENKCVEFNEGSLSGLELLDRAGFDTKVDAGNAMGVAVCKIGKDGCNFPTKPCFCQCQGESCTYWSYWRMVDGAWQYQANGASNTANHNGDLEGWVWGAGTTSSATPPQLTSFEQVCAVAAVTETITPTVATATATVTETGTPTQTRTKTLTPTRTQTLTPTPSLTPTTRPPTTTRLFIATNPPRPTARSVAQARPTNSPVVEIATEPPPPTETETPRPTLPPTKRPPTRVAINSGSGNAPNNGAETEVQHEADARTGRVLGLVLLGGIGVAGVGLFALVGGLIWYVYRRR